MSVTPQRGLFNRLILAHLSGGVEFCVEYVVQPISSNYVPGRVRYFPVKVETICYRFQLEIDGAEISHRRGLSVTLCHYFPIYN